MSASSQKNSPRLVLADSHTLEPYSVQGFQFLCRAAAFAEYWPAEVELWLPGPPVPVPRILGAIGMERLPENFKIRFGPEPKLRLGPLVVRSKSKYRRWVAREAVQLKTQAVFYLRTIKLAEVLGASGAAYFFEPHEIFFESAKSPQAFRQVEGRVYRGAIQLYPISHGLEKKVRALFPGPDIQVAPLGHSGANFALPDYDPGAEARLLYVGSLLGWKGLETVFAAAQECDLAFDVVGDAGGLERYREHCRASGFTRVAFHGHVSPENLPRHYLPGSICVLPLTRSEIAMNYTSPLKLFEYLASGRPILAGDVPSIREVVRDGEEAFLVPPEDVARWASAIRELAENRQRAAAVAAKGRALARQCTWSARAKPLADSMLRRCLP